MSTLLAMLYLGAIPPASARLNAFGMALMKARGESSDNVLFSPISASAAMTLLLDASAGKTEHEIQAAMHLDGDAEVGALLRSITDTQGKEVTVANAIFAPPDMTLGDSFVRDVQSTLGATIERLRDSAGGGIAQVNDWVSNATKRRIPYILDSLDPGSIVLANAVTFDGLWAMPFHESNTHDSIFYAVGGDQQVPMMQRTGLMTYRDLADRQEVELPYRGGQFRMRIMLPKGNDPKAVLDTLPPEPATDRSSQSVDLKLPRFTFSSNTDLRGPLTKVGLGSIFTRADLSRMSPGHAPTRVGKALQRAWIQVDETGTKAAAATIIVTPTAIFGGARSIPFYVDRPFAFTIEDSKSNTILFAGIVRRVP